MINYTNINDAWGISLKKETFKNSKEEQIDKEETKDKFTNNDNNETKDDYNALRFSEEEIKKFKNALKNFSLKFEKLKKDIKIKSGRIERLENIIEEMKYEQFRNKNYLNKKSNNIETFSTIDVIKNYFTNFNVEKFKQLKILSLLVSILIISILLIQSFRKPIKINGPDKNFYVFPDEVSKLRKLLNN